MSVQVLYSFGMDTPDGPPVLRIGELSRRLGVSDHVLRAWESRYGLLQPVRSAGGFRLYSEADESRVRRMQAHLAHGLSAAEAARAVLGEDSGAATAGPRRRRVSCPMTSGRPWTPSTSQPHRQSLTGSCPTSPSRQCFATWYCRI